MSTLYFDLPLIEWIGYAASTLVLISLSLSSIVKLRIYNLIGAAIFSFYGFYINALPVGIMNLVICFFNIYYLRSLVFKKELFDGLYLDDIDAYTQKFLTFHQRDIQRFFPNFNRSALDEVMVLMAMRDMKVAGIMIATKPKGGESEVLLDYVIPQYRDYKTGKHLLKKFSSTLIKKGTEHLVSVSDNKLHIKYLHKIGFEREESSRRFRLALRK